MNTRKKDRTLTRVTVSVDPDDYSRMEQLAKTSGLSTAWLIRKAMSEFLERQQKEKNISITTEH